MLVLSRKSGEKICIDGAIEVTVVKVKGSRVSLGIKAPKDVKVLRGELFEEWMEAEDKLPPGKKKSLLVPTELTPVAQDQFLAWSI